MHLVFYDGECGFCDHVVQFLLRRDNSQIFSFAPLQGSTAKELLKNLPKKYWNEDSLVLIQNYKTSEQRFYILGKAALRILWLLGGRWSLLGWISFLPGWLYNWIYRIIAKNRHRLFNKAACVIPDPNSKNRFLP